MPTKTKRPMPSMWIEKSLSCRMEGNFNHQHYQLSNLLPDQETVWIFISMDSFRQLIDTFKKTSYGFLQVFIGSYDDGQSTIAENKNKLMLMFSASKDLKNGPPPYYSIDPNGVFFEDSNYAQWISNYNTHKLPLLTANLIPEAKENYSGNPKVFSDTKRIHYEAADIQELLDEIDYQETVNKTKVIGFRAYFSSYCHTGRPGSKTTEYVNRIFVIFELIKLGAHGEEVVFYLDDQPNSKGRTHSGEYHGVDNGHLCPPNCP